MELLLSPLLRHFCLSFILFPRLSLSSDSTHQLISLRPGVSRACARTHLRPGGTWRSGACWCVCRAPSLEGAAQQVLITQTSTAHCMNLFTSDWCWHTSVRVSNRDISCRCWSHLERPIVVAQRKFWNFFVAKCATLLKHLFVSSFNPEGFLPHYPSITPTFLSSRRLQAIEQERSPQVLAIQHSDEEEGREDHSEDEDTGGGGTDSTDEEEERDEDSKGTGSPDSSLDSTSPGEFALQMHSLLFSNEM